MVWGQGIRHRLAHSDRGLYVCGRLGFWRIPFPSLLRALCLGTPGLTVAMACSPLLRDSRGPMTASRSTPHLHLPGPQAIKAEFGDLVFKLF